MSVQRFYTIEEKRDFVYEYVGQPHGSKARFRREQGVTTWQMRSWRAQVFAGTVEFGLIPRQGGAVSVEESKGLARLVAENEALREQLRAEQDAHERALADMNAELAVQKRAVDALGKAIEILHNADAGKISRTPSARPEEP